MSNSKPPPPPTYDEVNRPDNLPSAPPPPSYEDTLDQITADLASNQLYDRPPEADELPEKVPIPDSDPDVGPSTSRASAPPRPKIRPGSLFPDRNLKKVAGEEEQLPREPSDIEKKVVYTDPDLKAKVTPFNPPRSLAWMLDQDVPPQSVTPAATVGTLADADPDRTIRRALLSGPPILATRITTTDIITSIGTWGTWGTWDIITTMDTTGIADITGADSILDTIMDIIAVGITQGDTTSVITIKEYCYFKSYSL
ncbi:hypothetical protein WR25_07056 [Diploscapter pachys]|uniref:Uncharacterized protein n=1 Tax=Diploscapter pachys TaxID=2018661 RepID=A0A2A2JS48_9BILA|nr:hypothetical protein WR25_07056 [Diploscapter pachys]